MCYSEFEACCVLISCMSTGYKYNKYNIFSPSRAIISRKRKELETEELAKLGKKKSQTACQIDLHFLPPADPSAPGAVGSNLKNVLCWVRYTTSPSCSTMLFHSHFFRIIHFSSIIPQACLILPSVLYSATTHDSKLGRRGVSNTQVMSILFLRNNSRLFCEITQQGFQKSRGEPKKSTQMRHLQSFLSLCSSKPQQCYLPDHVSIYTSAIFGNVRVGG